MKLNADDFPPSPSSSPDTIYNDLCNFLENMPIVEGLKLRETTLIPCSWETTAPPDAALASTTPYYKRGDEYSDTVFYKCTFDDPTDDDQRCQALGLVYDSIRTQLYNPSCCIDCKFYDCICNSRKPNVDFGHSDGESRSSTSSVSGDYNETILYHDHSYYIVQQNNSSLSLSNERNCIQIDTPSDTDVEIDVESYDASEQEDCTDAEKLSENDYVDDTRKKTRQRGRLAKGGARPLAKSTGRGGGGGVRLIGGKNMDKLKMLKLSDSARQQVKIPYSRVKRKSAEDQVSRRNEHNSSERCRRLDMKDNFLRLQQEIGQADKKMAKHEILMAAKETAINLDAEAKKLEKEKVALEEYNKELTEKLERMRHGLPVDCSFKSKVKVESKPEFSNKSKRKRSRRPQRRSGRLMVGN